MLKSLLHVILLSFFMLFINGCNENQGELLTSPHTIECATDTECLANDSLAPEEGEESYGYSTKDDEQIVALYEDTASFFEGFSSHFFVLHEPSASYANAFASKKDGYNYIYFGREMFYLLKNDNPDKSYINVLGVMSHEYGHIVQFNTSIDESKIEVTPSNNLKNPLKRQTVNVGSTVVLSELEADAFSGYFMYSHLRSRDAVIDYITMMADLGDKEFGSEQHHGTPQQRKEAAELGIIAAKKLVENNVSLTWEELRYSFLGRIESEILYPKDFE